MSTPFRLRIPQALYDAMLDHAVGELPNECCGLLAGTVVPAADGRDSPEVRIGRVVRRFPLVNAAASRVEYLSDPRSMFDAVRAMRDEGVDILAVYHSHPTSDPVPSRTDLERNYSPDVMTVIVSLKTGSPRVAAWWLTADEYREAEWECGPV